MLDLHVHLLGHMDRQATEENIQQYLLQARHQQIRQIGFADHDYYWDHLNLPLLREMDRNYPEVDIRIGLEVEYKPGEESRIKGMKEAFNFDYLIGSVHEIGEWAFDYPEAEAVHQQKDSDTLYRDYFGLVEKAACSGLFNIIGHFDLIKIFNVRPVTDVRILAATCLEAIKDHKLTVEINTNGRYKPVQEFYPEVKLIQAMQKMEIPFTIGSDAHEALVVGRDVWEVCQFLKNIGVKDIKGFQQQRPQTYLL